MRPAPLLAASAALLLSGFAAGRLLPAVRAERAAGPAVRYACPMHPAVTSDHPGAAPCCGMALEPVRQGPSGAALPPGAVAIDGRLRQLQGVKVAAAERRATVQRLRLLGRVAAEEGRVHALHAAMEGAVTDLSGATTGAAVRRGERLGGFFSADMRAALQSYLTALDVIDQDPVARAASPVTMAAGTTPLRNASFVAERLRAMGVSDRQLDEMRLRRLVPITIDIFSPVDGVVLARGVTPGQRFERGVEWFRIANLDKVWILADLPEGDAALVRPGAEARLRVPGRPGTLAAVVSRVPPTFDAASRTLKVRLEADNPGGLLRPDMYVDAELEVARPAALTLPIDAVVDAGLHRTVFVEVGDGLYQPRQVETGWRAAGQVEVVGGLAPGERVVVSGVFLVDSERQLRAAAAPPAAPAPAPAPGAGPSAAAAGPAHDPICGMAVDPAQARSAGRVAERDGEAWFFCSDGCLARFRQGEGTLGSAGHPGHGALHAQAGSRP